MIHYRQLEEDIFSAPLLPGSSSLVQKYFKLSRWLTFPLLIGFLFAVTYFWNALPALWLWVILIALPVNFILLHLVVVKFLVQMDENRYNHKLCVGEETITIHDPEKGTETFFIRELKKISWMYSGFERAFLPQGPYFSGGHNELAFEYNGRKVKLRFRLTSPAHRQKYQKLLTHWYEQKFSFEEYSRTSGVPVLVEPKG